MVEKSNCPKIIVLTLPLRDTPTNFPPLGSLSVISTLKRAGFKDTHFYNLDILRPSDEENIAYFEKEKPDIIGISAVVSTHYAYTKRLCRDIKKILPDVPIILGGNLGASAEVLLKKTEVDFVCSGEGDRVAVDFVQCWLSAKSKSAFKNVDGLAFLDEQGELVMTPYAKSIEAGEIYDIDWSIMEENGQLDFYIQPSSSSAAMLEFGHDPKYNEPHRKNKSTFTIVTSKGCVAKCSFCHRWDTGIRFIPVPILMKRIDYFIEKHNVGFIQFGDENFGSDKKWLNEFLIAIKPRDLIWTVSGMRARTVSNDLLRNMKDAGCCKVSYGLESGSQAMLDVMDKIISVEQNYNAIKWTVENNLATCLQFVIAMPGETPESIQETAEFACFYAELSPEIDPNNAGINFAQALPGTPLYEFARRKGLIGPTIEDEENYLLKISNRDARDGETNINFTDYPRLMLEDWHFEIQIKTRNAFVQKWGIEKYDKIIMKNFSHFSQVRLKKENSEPKVDADSGYYAYPARAKEKLTGHDEWSSSIWWLIKNEIPGLIPMHYPTFFWHARYFSVLFILPWSFQKYGIKPTIEMFVEYIGWKFMNLFSLVKKKIDFEPVSLRKTVLKDLVPPIQTDNPAMIKFRRGR